MYCLDKSGRIDIFVEDEIVSINPSDCKWFDLISMALQCHRHDIVDRYCNLVYDLLDASNDMLFLNLKSMLLFRKLENDQWMFVHNDVSSFIISYWLRNGILLPIEPFVNLYPQSSLVAFLSNYITDNVPSKEIINLIHGRSFFDFCKYDYDYIYIPYETDEDVNDTHFQIQFKPLSFGAVSTNSKYYAFRYKDLWPVFPSCTITFVDDCIQVVLPKALVATPDEIVFCQKCSAVHSTQQSCVQYQLGL